MEHEMVLASLLAHLPATPYPNERICVSLVTQLGPEWRLVIGADLDEILNPLS
jgi:hypothetical protein